MIFKKALAALLSVTMIACLTACGEKETSSKKEDSKEIVTETVAVDEQDENLQEDFEMMEEEAEEAHDELLEMEEQAEEEAMADADAIAQEALANYDPENPVDTVITILRNGFETSFGDNMEVTYNEAETKYIISVWQDGFAAALETDQGATALNSLSDTLADSLRVMTDQVRMIHADSNIEFNFLSDKDQETVLLTIENGEMTYSITE